MWSHVEVGLCKHGWPATESPNSTRNWKPQWKQVGRMMGIMARSDKNLGKTRPFKITNVTPAVLLLQNRGPPSLIGHINSDLSPCLPSRPAFHIVLHFSCCLALLLAPSFFMFASVARTSQDNAAVANKVPITCKETSQTRKQCSKWPKRKPAPSHWEARTPIPFSYLGARLYLLNLFKVKTRVNIGSRLSHCCSAVK